MSVNRVIITGNLGSEPELRRTQSGIAILSMSVAVNDRRRNKQTGEYEDYCNWIDSVMFGTRAESVSGFLHKGSKVGIDGKLRYRTWKDKQGNNRSKIEVVVDDIELLDTKSGPSGGGKPSSAPEYVEATVYESNPVYDDDIPF